MWYVEVVKFAQIVFTVITLCHEDLIYSVQVEFSDGQSASTIVLTVKDDGIPEMEETSLVTLTAVVDTGSDRQDRGAHIGMSEGFYGNNKLGIMKYFHYSIHWTAMLLLQFLVLLNSWGSNILTRSLYLAWLRG